MQWYESYKPFLLFSFIAPAVAITVGGDIYAFNQDSDASTLELYNRLVSRVP